MFFILFFDIAMEFLDILESVLDMDVNHSPVVKKKSKFNL